MNDDEGETRSTVSRKNGVFQNPFPEFRFLGFRELIQFMWTKDNSNVPEKEELSQTLPQHNNFHEADQKSENTVTWIGHASALIKLSSVYVLTDPVFSPYCSAIQMDPSGKTKRYSNPGLELEELPKVDAVVISHNHYDHLDYKSVCRIQKLHPKTKWFVPLGLKSWFVRWIQVPSENIQEMDWWDSTACTFDNTVALTFTCVPAQHWSFRNGFDRNHSLWSGWCIKSIERNVYFAGDTGYNNRIFKEIGKFHGPFDLSLIPIGAYEPRRFLKCQHVNPAEAAQVHLDVGSRLSVGIHWGTFKLGVEFYLAPLTDLQSALQKLEIDSQDFITLRHGECKAF